MQVTRTSQLTGKITTMDLPITWEQIEAYDNGELLQNAFPNLDANQREFYKTGISSEEWDSMFSQEDDEEDMELEPT